MLLFCVRLEKSSGEDTAAPLAASTTVIRTPSLPGFQKFEDVPCPIPPPPPSMFPLPPDANAVEGTRQNTTFAAVVAGFILLTHRAKLWQVVLVCGAVLGVAFAFLKIGRAHV